jgi:hypothetical protein
MVVCGQLLRRDEPLPDEDFRLDFRPELARFPLAGGAAGRSAATESETFRRFVGRMKRSSEE